MPVLGAIFLILRGLVRGRAALTLENLALRQQLAVLRRSAKRPRLRPRDRLPPHPSAEWTAPEHLGAEIGCLAVLDTWGQTLHPRIHCVVPGGGLSPNRRQWVACWPSPEPSVIPTRR